MVCVDDVLKKHNYLLHHLSKKFHIQGYTTEDLYQEFAMVLCDCVKKFDKNRGTKFKTYLYRSIMGRAYQLITHADVYLSLDEMLNSEATHLEMLESMDLTPDKLDEMNNLEDFIMHELFSNEYIKHGHVTYAILVKGLTYKEVGDRCGLTKQRIQQIHKENLDILRKRYEEYIGE